MKDLVYLVGPPGVGKSTLMAELTSHCDRVPRTGPGSMRYDTLYRPQTAPETARIVGAELGVRRDSFSGTDALGMAVNPDAIEWVSSESHYGLVLGEGARLANARFLLAAVMAGFTVHLVYVAADPGVLAVRRAKRGSSQNASWVKGAETRARRIMGSMQGDVNAYRADTTMLTPAQSADSLTAAIPVLGVLR